MKDTLRRVAGLFVEIPPEPANATEPAPKSNPTGTGMPDYSKLSDTELLAALEAAGSTKSPTAQTKTVEQIVKDRPGPNLDEIKPAAEPETQVTVLGPDGKVDFGAIYRLAKLPEEAFTAENVIEVISQLPAELPLEAKRATLKVTLGAMAKTSGASVESVISDASRKMAALDAYADSYEEQARKYVSLAEAEIAKLEAQIAERKRSLADANAKAVMVREQCGQQVDYLDDVLEFFTLDVPPSKHS